MSFEDFADENPSVLLLDGFKNAMVGYGERINLGPVLIYDKDKIIEMLMKEMVVEQDDLYDGQTEDEKNMKWLLNILTII
jgi:hypothetical protein